MSLKVIGAGLSRTGTTSLHNAVQTLGMSSVHYGRKRLDWAIDGKPGSFRRYDDVEAVFDVPAAFFWHEIRSEYPEAQVILSTRDEHDWWDSVVRYFDELPAVQTMGARQVARWLKDGTYRSRRREQVRRDRLRELVYGSATPDRERWISAYRKHNDSVRALAAPGSLLEIKLADGAGWKPICDFLSLPVPDVGFPRSNAGPER